MSLRGVGVGWNNSFFPVAITPGRGLGQAWSIVGFQPVCACRLLISHRGPPVAVMRLSCLGRPHAGSFRVLANQLDGVGYHKPVRVFVGDFDRIIRLGFELERPDGLE